MQQVLLKDLLEAGCHFGHKSERWHPKASQFIYQERDGIHVIDLVKTKSGLEKAAAFIKSIVESGGTILFIGTKRQAASIIKREAERVGAPYISQRWIGGFLTNWSEVHKNLERIRRLTEEEKNNAWKKYPKHERVKLSRYLKKLLYFYSGVLTLTDLPQALVVIDIRREEVAVREAQKMGIPIIGVVDTNSDPTLIDYPIPSNDDAVGAVEYLVHYLSEAFREGKEEFAKKNVDQNQVKPASVEQKPKEEKPEVKEIEKQVVDSEKNSVDSSEEKPGAVKEADKKTDEPKLTEPTKKKRGRPKKEKSV